MLHGLPVAVFAAAGAGGSQMLANNLPMLHFDEFLTLPDMPVAHSVEELIAVMPRIADLTDGPELGKRLKKEAGWFTSSFDRPWNQRIVEFLTGCVAASGRAKLKGAE